MLELSAAKTIFRQVFNWYIDRLEALARCPTNGIDAFWRETSDQICDLSNRLQNQSFAMDLWIAVYLEIERISKTAFSQATSKGA